MPGTNYLNTNNPYYPGAPMKAEPIPLEMAERARYLGSKQRGPLEQMEYAKLLNQIGMINREPGTFQGGPDPVGPRSPAAMTHTPSSLGPASMVTMRGDVDPEGTLTTGFNGPFPSIPEPNAGPTNMFPNVPADRGLEGPPKIPDYTNPEYIPGDAMTQQQYAAEQNQNKAMGEMTFATGLNMLAKASTMPDFKGMLGGMGTTFAGMAQMAGKGGKWAMPVAMLSTLTYLAGERNSQNMQVKRNVRLANAYGRALAAAGGKYGK